MSKKFGLGKGLNALIPEETNLSSLGNKIEKKEGRLKHPSDSEISLVCQLKSFVKAKPVCIFNFRLYFKVGF